MNRELPEVSAVAELLAELSGGRDPAWLPEAPTRPKPDHRAEVPPRAGPAPARPAPPAPSRSRGFRQDVLTEALASMCQRAGFQGAALADGAGLPLASYEAPFEGTVLAAMASILGEALEKVAGHLGMSGGTHVSMDLGYADKLVVHRFDVEDTPFYLVVLCGQDIDERAEMELTSEMLREALAPGGLP